MVAAAVTAAIVVDVAMGGVSYRVVHHVSGCQVLCRFRQAVGEFLVLFDPLQ